MITVHSRVTDARVTLQTGLLEIAQWTADGLLSVRVLKLAMVAHKPERAAILRLRMAARIV